RTRHESSARRTLRHGSVRCKSAGRAFIKTLWNSMGIHPLPDGIVTGPTLRTAHATARSDGESAETADTTAPSIAQPGEARMTRLRSASAWQANQHELERAENHEFETRSFPN